jgi:hypothetical protein
MPVDAEDLLGDQRAAEDAGTFSAMTVTTGISELRSTWRRTTTLAHALGARGAHIVLLQVVEHRGAHVAADLGGVVEASTIIGMTICWSWKTKLSQSSITCVVS